MPIDYDANQVPGRALIESALGGGARSLDEEAGKRFFAEYGISVPEGVTVTSPDEAVKAAAKLGYPVVMKGSSVAIQHKTDAGLVLLGIADETEVREGYRTLQSRAAAAGAKLDGILVEHMVKGKREFVVGLIRDHLFGPVVMFGLGGIFTEALHDVAFAVTPLSDADAAELLDQIRARDLLGPFRGSPAVDRGALVAVLQAVGRMAADHLEIREIDVNPLLIDGAEPVAVDALITLGEPREPSTRPPADVSQLHSLVAPRSVAVVGASSDTAKWGGMLIANLRLGCFPGPIYPVNPKGGEIMGLPVHKSIAELPETPELVIVAVAAPLVKDAMEECGRKGVSAVVVVSAGFSELGPEGRQLEDEIVAVAERYGMALVGPNCMGVISSHHQLYGTGFTLLRPDPGGASMVSQSGNLGIQLLVSAERRKGGVGKFIGVGNEAMIDAVDFINYLRSDPETNTIVTYMEGFDDGRRLLDVVRATSLEKPVVILRGGTSPYGQKAAASHTGALASSSAVFDAAARQSGMIVTTDPDEFLDLTFALSYMPLPPGKRVAVATLGGGWGVLVADEISRSGLELANLSPQVIAKLGGLLPAFWSHSNPVDMVATLTPGVPETVLETLVASEEVDAVIVLGVVGSMNESRRAMQEIEAIKAEHGGQVPIESCVMNDREEAEPELSERELQFIRDVADLMERYRKPIANISNRPMSQAIFSGGGRYAAFVLPSPLRAVRVLAKMAGYGAHLRRFEKGPAAGGS
ncbi:MAG: acetate--CoA ligase family protein [Actinobacteria bacterium]|nr:acetate--CoA ligase family protein [Actinomycetota bacterium]